MMGRQPRLVADGLVYHARNRGNNRQAVLSDDADRAADLGGLNNFTNALELGMRDQEAIAAILGSDEYFGRF